MALSEAKIREYSLKLLSARNSIVIRYPFFGFLLSYLGFALDEECETACTDGEKIMFGTGFIDKLSNDEIVFLMMHELMHCVLNHTGRRKGKIDLAYNIAADIVCNSMILETLNDDEKNITIDGEIAMHTAPDGKEGREYSTEQIYLMLQKKIKAGSGGGGCGKGNGKGGEGKYKILDSHDLWGSDSAGDGFGGSDWRQRIIAAADHTKSYGNSGHLPSYIRKYLKDLNSHEVDWKTALYNFCQRIELMDYSWLRADKRYSEQDIFLPDYTNDDSNELEVSDLLFFVDTSGSMSDKEVTLMMAEIRSAISIFNNRLSGKIGFFDTKVIEPVSFTDEDSFEVIRPKGCGGTNFGCIFEYVRKRTEKPPVAIIIMTDGYAPFPKESAAGGIPVLWIINNSEISPPWGEVIRTKPT